MAQADIILMSSEPQDSGAQTHGLFYSFDEALEHAKKDGAHPEAEWVMSKPDRACFLDGRIWWVASKEKVRGSRSQQPSGEK